MFDRISSVQNSPIKYVVAKNIYLRTNFLICKKDLKMSIIGEYKQISQMGSLARVHVHTTYRLYMQTLLSLDPGEKKKNIPVLMNSKISVWLLDTITQQMS